MSNKLPNLKAPADKVPNISISTLAGVICTNPGKAKQPVYKKVYDEKLKKFVVKKVDETDLFEFIQASRNTTDLAALQKQFIALGEIPAVDGTYGDNDLASMPNNIHEVYKMANDVDGSFRRLPEDIQKAFGTSDAYMQALLNGTYQATILKYFGDKQKVDDKPKEVKENE